MNSRILSPMIHIFRHSLAFALYSFPLFTLFLFFIFQKEKILLQKTKPTLRMLSAHSQAQQGQGTFQ